MEKVEIPNPLPYGEICWVKIHGMFPWWPAMIYNPEDAAVTVQKYARRCLGFKYTCLFFSTGNFGFPAPSQILGFNENFKELSKQSVTKSFESQFKEAVRLAQMQIKKPLDRRTAWSPNSYYDSKYFEEYAYLVDTLHHDPEDKKLYKTKEVTVENDYIVGYRVHVDKRGREIGKVEYEDPICIQDIEAMTKESNVGIVSNDTHSPSLHANDKKKDDEVKTLKNMSDGIRRVPAFKRPRRQESPTNSAQKSDNESAKDSPVSLATTCKLEVVSSTKPQSKEISTAAPLFQLPHLLPITTTVTTSAAPTATVTSSSNSSLRKSKLQELKNTYDEGFITFSVYEQMQMKIFVDFPL